MKRGFWKNMTAVGLVTAVALVAVAQDEPGKSQTAPQNPPTPDQPAQATPASGGPRLELSQKEWNFGEVWQGEPCAVEVNVKNTGDAPMTIEVKSSCGCTVPTKPKSPLGPGESDKLKISYNSAKRRGPAQQTVTILTNDPTQRSVAFTVKGTVKPMYDLKPQDGLVFGALMADSVESRSVEIVNKYSEKMTLKVKDSSENGPFDIQLKELEPGMRWELTAKTKPPMVDGRQKAEIILATENAKVPEIRIPVNAFVQPPVSIRPAKLFLPKNSDKEITRSVFVQFNVDKPVKITGVKATPDIIRVEVSKEPTPDKNQPKQASWELKVVLPKGDQIKSDDKPMIEITTDAQDPKFQKFTVAVQIVDPGKAPPITRPGAEGAQGMTLTPAGAASSRPTQPPQPSSPPAEKK